jgi:hypothetical protein
MWAWRMELLMPAGRPAELDTNGKPIAKCLVNCTIPVKLRDFLAEHKINRSELFRTAALKMMELKICPYCYSDDIKETPKGWRCSNEFKYGLQTANSTDVSGCGKWLKFKRCELCEAIHTPKSSIHAVNGKIGCDECPEVIKQKEDNKKINVVFGNE